MAPGIPTNGWTVREGSNGTLVLKKEDFVKSPTLIFDTLPSGQLVTTSGYIVGLSNTSELNPEPQLFHPTDLVLHPKAELRCYPDNQEALDCSVETEAYVYTRFTLLNQLGTSLTFSTPLRDSAGHNNPAHTLRLEIVTDANCFDVQREPYELPHGKPTPWDNSNPSSWHDDFFGPSHPPEFNPNDE
jgi:hypothetical protein